MTKQEFINCLSERLKGLPKEEITKSIDFYTEIIEDAVENGEDEQEVTARLGSIDEIAEKIINEMPLSRIVKENVKAKKLSKPAVIGLIVGSPIWLSLLISALSAVFAVYAAVWSIIIAFFAVFAALALSGIALLVAAPFVISVMPWRALFMFGTALAFIGISVFVFYFSVWLSKLMVNATVSIFKKIKEWIMRKAGACNEDK